MGCSRICRPQRESASVLRLSGRKFKNYPSFPSSARLMRAISTTRASPSTLNVNSPMRETFQKYANKCDASHASEAAWSSMVHVGILKVALRNNEEVDWVDVSDFDHANPMGTGKNGRFRHLPQNRRELAAAWTAPSCHGGRRRRSKVCECDLLRTRLIAPHRRQH